MPKKKEHFIENKISTEIKSKDFLHTTVCHDIDTSEFISLDSTQSSTIEPPTTRKIGSSSPLFEALSPKDPSLPELQSQNLSEDILLSEKSLDRHKISGPCPENPFSSEPQSQDSRPDTHKSAEKAAIEEINAKEDFLSHILDAPESEPVYKDSLSHSLKESVKKDPPLSSTESELVSKKDEIAEKYFNPIDKANLKYYEIPYCNKTDLFLLEKIGRGGSAEVYFGKTTNEFLALKRFDRKQLEHALHEDAILRTVEAIRSNDRYPMAYRSFLKYHGLFRGKFFGELEEGLIMIMEAGLLTLETVFTQKRMMSEAHLFFFLSEMTNLLAILQENGIAHGDIKPTNIVLFLNEKKEISFKLIDFGVSIKLADGADGMVGPEMIKGLTLYYASPEILSLGRTSSKINIFKSDAFSLGLLILELAGLKKRKRTDEALASFPSQVEKLGYKNLIPILTHLVDLNPNDRFDFLQLRQMLDSYNFQQEIPLVWDLMVPVLDQIWDRTSEMIAFFELRTAFFRYKRMYEDSLDEWDSSESIRYYLGQMYKVRSNIKYLGKNTAESEDFLREYDEVYLLSLFADSYLKRGEYQAAENYNKLLINLIKDKNSSSYSERDSKLLSQAYHDLALLYENIGEIDEANKWNSATFSPSPNHPRVRAHCPLAYLETLRVGLLPSVNSSALHESASPMLFDLESMIPWLQSVDDSYRETGDLEKAETLYLHLANIIRDQKSENSPEFANFLISFAKIQVLKGNYKNAEKCYYKALGIFLRNLKKKNVPHTLIALLNLVVFKLKDSKPENLQKLEKLLLQATNLSLDLDRLNYRTKVHCFRMLARLYESMGQFSVAKSWLNFIQRQVKGLSRDLDYEIRQEIGLLCLQNREYPEALEWFLSPGMSRVNVGLIPLQSFRGHFLQAAEKESMLKCLEVIETLRGFNKSKLEGIRSKILIDLAVHSMDSDDFSVSKGILTDLLDRVKKEDDPKNAEKKAKIKFYLGRLYRLKGDLSRARKTLEASSRGLEIVETAYVNCELARVYMDKKEWDLAEETYQENLKIIEREDLDDEVMVETLKGLGFLKIQMGCPQRAMQFLKIALEWVKDPKRKSPKLIADVHMNMGLVYLKQRDFMLSKASFSNSLEILHSLSLDQQSENLNFAKVLLYLFALYKQHNPEKFSLLMKILLEALKWLKENRGSWDFQAAFVHLELAEQFRSIGKKQKAKNHFLESIRICESQAFRDRDHVWETSRLGLSRIQSLEQEEIEMESTENEDSFSNDASEFLFLSFPEPFPDKKSNYKSIHDYAGEEAKLEGFYPSENTTACTKKIYTEVYNLKEIGSLETSNSGESLEVGVEYEGKERAMIGSEDRPFSTPVRAMIDKKSLDFYRRSCLNANMFFL